MVPGQVLCCQDREGIGLDSREAHVKEVIAGVADRIHWRNLVSLFVGFIAVVDHIRFALRSPYVVLFLIARVGFSVRLSLQFPFRFVLKGSDPLHDVDLFAILSLGRSKLEDLCQRCNCT